MMELFFLKEKFGHFVNIPPSVAKFISSKQECLRYKSE
jgi:hypothetical protein